MTGIYPNAAHKPVAYKKCTTSCLMHYSSSPLLCTLPDTILSDYLLAGNLAA